MRARGSSWGFRDAWDLHVCLHLGRELPFPNARENCRSHLETQLWAQLTTIAIQGQVVPSWGSPSERSSRDQGTSQDTRVCLPEQKPHLMPRDLKIPHSYARDRKQTRKAETLLSNPLGTFGGSSWWRRLLELAHCSVLFCSSDVRPPPLPWCTGAAGYIPSGYLTSQHQRGECHDNGMDRGQSYYFPFAAAF